MAPAMSTPVRIAGEQVSRPGDAFTRGFGWTKSAARTPTGGVRDGRRLSRESHRRPADGPGRPA